MEGEDIQIIRRDEDGNEIRVPAPEAVQEQAKAQDKAEDAKVANKERIAELLRPSAKIIVQTEKIEVCGVKMLFHVKKLPYREASRIDAKRYRRKPNGQLEFSNEHAETVGIAWQIHECIMRNAKEGQFDGEGKPVEPDWVKMYSLEEILGSGKEDEPDVNSLMGNPEETASEYVYALTSAVWRVNPTLSPLNQSAAMDALGMK